MLELDFYVGKGGVGKSTLAVNSAGYLSQKMGKKVCVVDLDPQQSLTDIYMNEINQFDVVSNLPGSKKGRYDVIIYDHHPSQCSVKLHDFVISPIRPSRVDFESYKRSRSFLGLKQHMLVVNHWSMLLADDMLFIQNMKNLSKKYGMPMSTIKKRNIYKRCTDAGDTVFDAKNKYGAAEARNEIGIMLKGVMNYVKI